MIVYVFRHGPAVDIGEAGVRRDEDRMLSEEGRRKTAGAARGLLACECTPECVFTSPLIRARETAEIVAAELGLAAGVKVAGELAPGAGLERTMKWLGELTRESIMLVGHLPGLAELASIMVAGNPGIGIMLKKASLCRIVFGGRIVKGQGQLEWLLQPAMLRKLGK